MSSSRLVYSTDAGRLCPDCGFRASECQCNNLAKEQINANDGIVRVGRSTKGRKGKGVTTITGLPLSIKDIQSLAKKLKQACGTGGSVKDGTIEIQGDHRDLLIEKLKAAGFTVKRSGG